MSYVIKQVPEDFVVREVPRATPAPKPGEHAGAYAVFELEKRGLTTLEALSRFEEHAELARTQLGHAGLKDEDAVTLQYVTVLAVDGQELPGSYRFEQGENHAEFRRAGSAAEAFRPGSLEGNSFWIRLRGMDPRLCRALEALSGEAIYLLNYYDVQRFGVPDGPKTTHLLGGALRDGRYDTALGILRGQGSPEAAAARGWTDSAEAFFQQMDPRLLSLYLSASSSFAFNVQLRGVAEKELDTTEMVDVEGLTYVYGVTGTAGTTVVNYSPTLPYSRYVWADGEMREKRLSRPTLLPVRPQISAWEADGDAGCDLAFFLPSGSYATAVVRQLVRMAEYAAGDGRTG